MADTVTSYNTFVAGTKARASQVNTNFSNHRGTNIPINTDTATGSDNTHDLGTTDHRWRRAYLGAAPYINGTQVGRIEIAQVYDGTSPCDAVDDIGDMNRIAFPTTRNADIRFGFTVPPTYVPGNPVSVNIKGYCETTGIFVLQSVASLYEVSVTNASLTAPSNNFTATSTITAQATANQFFENQSLRLTNATGQINGKTLAVGQRIAVNLARLAASDAADVNAGYLFITDIVVDLNL